MDDKVMRLFKQDEVAAALSKHGLLALPEKKGKLWTRSRLVIIDGPSGPVPVPILWLLAREAYPDWDQKTHTPVWSDKDWMNESVENVSLVEKGMGERVPSVLGLPAGSPEYYKAYRAKNKEKYRAYQREYAKRRREHFKALQAQYGQALSDVDVKMSHGLDDI